MLSRFRVGTNACLLVGLGGMLVVEPRECLRCGRMPTKDGYDACLGQLPGVTSACCGHGVEQGLLAIGQQAIHGCEWRDV